jgi:hypothetical protein
MELGNIYAAAEAIENGTWVPSPMFKGVEHRVRGSMNADALALRNKLIDAVPRVERINGLSSAKAAEIDARVLSETIWLDVRGLTDNKQPVDIAAAKAKLLDPKIGALLRADVSAASQLVGDDQIAGIEADAKN